MAWREKRVLGRTILPAGRHQRGDPFAGKSTRDNTVPKRVLGNSHFGVTNPEPSHDAYGTGMDVDPFTPSGDRISAAPGTSQMCVFITAAFSHSLVLR